LANEFLQIHLAFLKYEAYLREAVNAARDDDVMHTYDVRVMMQPRKYRNFAQCALGIRGILKEPLHSLDGHESLRVIVEAFSDAPVSADA
jgi:hypothetical protein